MQHDDDEDERKMCIIFVRGQNREKKTSKKCKEDEKSEMNKDKLFTEGDENIEIVIVNGRRGRKEEMKHRIIP